ncbi:outer membrane protein assembly factor BamD [Pasteurellaceae bacterium TAE3-ERU1]|nr:outer membrane protein assembly factor BamD [Pasteurellaceae bacterium TAE3-ERU1]
MHKLNSIALALVTALAITGCSSSDKKVEEGSVEQLYAKANTYLQDENYTQAIRYFDAVDSRYPFGAYSEQAQLSLIYANYKAGEYTIALADAERFLRMHSTSQHLDFVLYVAGLINSELGRHFMLDTFGADQALRDPLPMTNAMNNFNTLVQNFPNSRYAADAKARILYLHNALARHELHVAEFYFKRDAHVAVVNRVLGLVDHYPDTQAMYQALPLLEKSYLAMNLPAPAKQIETLIAQNKDKTFPKIPVPERDVDLQVPNVLAPAAQQ